VSSAIESGVGGTGTGTGVGAAGVATWTGVAVGVGAGVGSAEGAVGSAEGAVMNPDVLERSRMDRSLSYTDIVCSVWASVRMNDLIALKSGSLTPVSWVDNFHPC
jgi:hypothetical protein